MAKGKKKVELTKEEQQSLSLEKDLKDIMDEIHMLPKPRFILSIGDRVRIGAYIDPIITNVLLDGRAYEITYSLHHTNYGDSYMTHDNKRIVPWIDVRKLPEEGVQQFCIKDDLRLHYSQRTLSDFLSKAYKFGIDFNPSYQREHVWSLEEKINLIDSIYNNIDIGKFVYVHLPYVDAVTPMYEVLDGKQRATAILEFFEDKFQYRGKYFSELSNRDQSHFENYPVSYAEIQNATLEQKLQYFVRLNTGGRIMSKEHLDKVKQMLVDVQAN